MKSFELRFPVGPLGITIAPTERGAEVRDVRESCPHRVSLRVGDVVSFVGGKGVKSAAFERVVEVLQVRPVVIGFERRSESAARDRITKAARDLLINCCEEEEKQQKQVVDDEDPDWADFFASTCAASRQVDEDTKEDPSRPPRPVKDEVEEEDPSAVPTLDWRHFRRGAVKAAVRVADHRESSSSENVASKRESIVGVKLPGLAGPGAFVCDDKVDREFRRWDEGRDNRLEFTYEGPMPGLVSTNLSTTKKSTDDDDDAKLPLFDHIVLLGAPPRVARRSAMATFRNKKRAQRPTTLGRLEAQILHEFPKTKTVAPELAETICSFCAPQGLEAIGEVCSKKENAANAAKESQKTTRLSKVVHVFGGTDARPIYALTFKGFTRRDAHYFDDDDEDDLRAPLRGGGGETATLESSNFVVTIRSELRVVILTRCASLLSLHFCAGSLLTRDVGSAMSSVARARSLDNEACCAAAKAALSRFAISYARVEKKRPGVHSKWSPPPALDDCAFDSDTQGLRSPAFARKEGDVTFVRARGDVDAGQSVWDGDGAALLEWALPVLLRRLSLHVLLKALAALLAELTVVVECDDEADLSACVLGLLTLAKPLHPAGPMIVVLPDKFMDYLDSPVPVLLGVLKAPLQKLTSPTMPAGLLLRCDDPEHPTLLFGGATPELISFPAERRLLRALASPDQTLRTALRKTHQQCHSSPRAVALRRKTAAVPQASNSSKTIGTQYWDSKVALENAVYAYFGSSSGGVPSSSTTTTTGFRRNGSGSGQKTTSRSRSVPPEKKETLKRLCCDDDSSVSGTSVCVRDALREVARTITHHVAVLAAAALELAERRTKTKPKDPETPSRRPTWLLEAALGFEQKKTGGQQQQPKKKSPASTSPDDDDDDSAARETIASLPAFTAAFISSQLFANFRNSLDSKGGPAWIKRLAAALRPATDLDGFYNVLSKALRHHTVHRPLIRSGSRRRPNRNTYRRLWTRVANAASSASSSAAASFSGGPPSLRSS